MTKKAERTKELKEMERAMFTASLCVLSSVLLGGSAMIWHTIIYQ